MSLWNRQRFFLRLIFWNENRMRHRPNLAVARKIGHRRGHIDHAPIRPIVRVLKCFSLDSQTFSILVLYFCQQKNRVLWCKTIAHFEFFFFVVVVIIIIIAKSLWTVVSLRCGKGGYRHLSSYSISLKFSTELHRITDNTLQIFKVKVKRSRSQHSVTYQQ